MEIRTIKAGEANGANTVLQFHTAAGTPVYAIGVPMAWENGLGPTWDYFIETERPTLIDTGVFGSFAALEEGLRAIGRSVSDIKRFVVTHGHMDHDGNSHDLIEKGGAELWAHEVYGSLLKAVDRAEEERRMREQWHQTDVSDPHHLEWAERQKKHQEILSQLTVNKDIKDGDEVEGMRFLYAPGHSPDELCILFEGLLFTGDHILPQVTPHPSMKYQYRLYKDALPPGYREGNHYYGLRTYLSSLRKVSDLQQEVTIMPAHRLYYKGQLNLLGLERIREIAEHHLQRCYEILEHLKTGPKGLGYLTKRMFKAQHLEGNGFYLGVSELTCHIELMHDFGDVDFIDRGRKALWKGTTHFVQAFRELGF